MQGLRSKTFYEFDSGCRARRRTRSLHRTAVCSWEFALDFLSFKLVSGARWTFGNNNTLYVHFSDLARCRSRVCANWGVVGRRKRPGRCRFLARFIFGPIGIVIALLLPGIKTMDFVAKSAELADLNALIKNKGKVGIGVSPKDGRTVVTVADGLSAQKSGAQVGDRIITIDGNLCEGDYKAVALRLVGTVGSTVQVSIRRDNEARDFILLRG